MHGAAKRSGAQPSSAIKDPYHSSPYFVKKDLRSKYDQQILEVVNQVCLNYKDFPDRSSAVKTTLDQMFGSTWHVVVGQAFARSVQSAPMLSYFTDPRSLKINH